MRVGFPSLVPADQEQATSTRTPVTVTTDFNMPSGLTSLEMVTVGNAGNFGELSGTGAGGYGPDRICGAVGYTCQMGKFELRALATKELRARRLIRLQMVMLAMQDSTTDNVAH